MFNTPNMEHYNNQGTIIAIGYTTVIIYVSLATSNKTEKNESVSIRKWRLFMIPYDTQKYDSKAELTDFMAAAISSYLSACSASLAFCTSGSRSTILAVVDTMLF